jgi:hypothetical protein
MSADSTSVPLTVETWRSKPPDPPEVLRGSELFWSGHQKWLEDCGYMLRPRYLPGWVPSWEGKKKSWFDSEDGQFDLVSRLF